MYASQQTIVDIYGQAFLDDLLPADIADPADTVEKALASASAEIDGYLSARYSLPLSIAPKVLERPAIDVTAYILANRASRLTTTIEDRYDQAIEFLTKLSTGKAGLGAHEPKIDGGDNSPASASGAAFSARLRRFGREV